MSSTGNISLDNRNFVINFDTSFIGRGLIYNKQFIDKVHLNYSYKDNQHLLDINELLIKKSKLNGVVLMNSKQLSKVDGVVRNGDLEKLSYLFLGKNTYALDGVLDGRFTFSKNLDDQLFVDMKVQNFNMTHGQFGDVEVLLERKRDNINVKTLKFSGLHRLDLEGEIASSGYFNVRQKSKGLFRLGALRYSSRQKLFGNVFLEGQFSGTIENINFDGIVESENLIFDRIPINYIYFNGSKDDNNLQLEKFQLQLNEGKLFAKGDVTLPQVNHPIV